ncbi:Hsp70 family protein [Glycomyces terrestris]|uniref:Hsp70 family protein n=1 Tax=Glycomyces terrestris TaxID=2493553 RepID=A0A426UWG1_9ACTN|nr:Hsp70 family protein [Glycomyces terrestris]RRR98652.1 Hsp70 family protein [Glycomyces terrestris]
MTAIGIDLGTTNSVVARRDSDRADVEVVKIHGKASTPSVVGLRKRAGQDAEFLIGTFALNVAERDPKNTIQSVKRLMGRDFDDQAVRDAADRRPYAIVPGEGDDARAHVVMGDRPYTPEDVSTMILRHLRSGASDKLGEEVTHAVITVPAYFREAQRAATRKAGEAAGLVVKRIIDEPTAAAIAFGLDQREGEQRRVLVYDFGGGTFDISILNSVRDGQGRNHFQVLSYTGDNWLGGDDFDQLIVDRIVAWVRSNFGVDPAGDARFLFLAKRAAEKAKLELTEAPSAEIYIGGAFQDAGGLGDVEMELTRAEFDAMIEPLVSRTLDLVHEALGNEKLVPDQITDVILVGGSTLVPRVRAAVAEVFGAGKVRRQIDPMECVALGAAILADTLEGVECPNQECKAVNDDAAQECTQCGASLAGARSVGRDTNVYDVTGMALGVAAVKGSSADAFVPIIPRNTPYPLSEPMHGSFEVTDTAKIRMPVYEGNSTVASENHEQGLFEVALPPGVEMHAAVDVGMFLDKDRILHVTVSVPSVGLEETMRLQVDQERARAARPELVEDEPEDDYRDVLMSTMDGARRFLEVYEQYIAVPQAAKIRSDLDRAEEALMIDNPDECRRMVDVLNRDIFGSGLATQLYLAERAASQASKRDADSINESIAKIQEAHTRGSDAVVHDQARALKTMINRVYRENAGVQQIEDADDLGGILRHRP